MKRNNHELTHKICDKIREELLLVPTFTPNDAEVKYISMASVRYILDKIEKGKSDGTNI